MQLDSILYISYSITAITILVILAFLFWNRRSSTGARYMAVMMCSAALWGLSDFLSDLSSSNIAKIYFDKVSYFGVVTIPVAWLLFVIHYTKSEKYLPKKRLIYLLIIPSITVLLLWTNDFHHLMISEVSFVKTGQMMVLSTNFGYWFWVHAVYSYLFFLLGMLILVKKLIILPQILKKQSAIILIAILVPLSLNVLYTFKACPSYPIDPTIFSFTLTGILCFLGMFRYKLFDLIPAARDAVIEGMNGILVVVDNQNHIIDMNLRGRNIIYGSKNESNFVGKGLFEILGEWSPHFKKYEHVLNTEEKITFYSEGGRKYFDLKIAPLYDNKKKTVGRFITLYDITALEEAIVLSEQSRKEAEDANKAKSQFVATMSHEIRTPLNGIIGMTELLNSAKLTDEEKEYLESAQSCAISLLDIVNDILDFSKIEAGKMELEKTDINIRELIDTTFKTFVHRAKENDIEFICNVDSAIPDNLIGDPTRLRQIFVNLIGNAFKFTSNGKIEVAAELLKLENKQAVVQFSVSDTGIGIPDDKIGNLFNRFQQVDSSTTRKYGGTGLGLAIVKNLVSIMNGNIKVESILDKGSRFIYAIPFEATEKVAHLAAATSEIEFKNKHIKILLVEDNKTNQMLISKLLEKKNINFSIAGNGKEALFMLDKEEYNLILMDIQMPEMDGYETSAAIRKKEAVTGKHISIIALTANAAEEDREMCLKSGMDDYLTKPVRSEKLYKCLNKHINK